MVVFIDDGIVRSCAVITKEVLAGRALGLQKGPNKWWVCPVHPKFKSLEGARVTAVIRIGIKADFSHTINRIRNVHLKAILIDNLISAH